MHRNGSLFVDLDCVEDERTSAFRIRVTLNAGIDPGESSTKFSIWIVSKTWKSIPGDRVMQVRKGDYEWKCS